MYRPPFAAGRLLVQQNKDAWRSGSPPPDARQKAMI